MQRRSQTSRSRVDATSSVTITAANYDTATTSHTPNVLAAEYAPIELLTKDHAAGQERIDLQRECMLALHNVSCKGCEREPAFLEHLTLVDNEEIELCIVYRNGLEDMSPTHITPQKHRDTMMQSLEKRIELIRSDISDRAKEVLVNIGAFVERKQPLDEAGKAQKARWIKVLAKIA